MINDGVMLIGARVHHSRGDVLAMPLRDFLHYLQRLSPAE